MEQALAFARGDESAARVTTYTPEQIEAFRQQIREGNAAVKRALAKRKAKA